jgi:DNA-binding NarL/FixJ family response regulator
MRFRPEVALIRLELAELLLQSFPDRQPDAVAQLDLAVPELRSMGMEPALGRALRLAEQVDRPGRPKAPRTGREGLTVRETEVLRLVAAGKSNAEIADVLVVSVRTAERHLANIYNKLGTSGPVARATATAYAHTHGLVQTSRD